MIQRVFAGAYVHGVAVGEEGLAAQILDDIHQHPGVAGAQMRHVAQFAKVNFNGYVLVLEINPVNTGSENQPGQLLGKRLRRAGAEVGKVNLGCHKESLL